MLSVFISLLPYQFMCWCSLVYLISQMFLFFFFWNTVLCPIFMVIAHEPINKNNVKDMLFLCSINFWNLNWWIVLYFTVRNVKQGILSTESLIISPVPDTSMLTFLKLSFLHFLKIPFGNMLHTHICRYMVFLTLSNAWVNELSFYEELELICTLFPQACRARELFIALVCVKKGFHLFWPNVSSFTNLTY